MSRTSRLLAGLVLLVAPTAAQEWERILPGLELSYPADHGAHPAYQTEWWYLTGNVADETGRRYGFQFTIFRRGLDPRPPAPDASPLRARQVWAGHLAIADVEGGRTHFAERLRRDGTPLARGATDELDLVLEDWTLRRTADDRLVLRAADPSHGMELALELRPQKPPVLHGEAGYSRKGADPGNASAYMSWTRLSVEGTLAVGDRDTRAVHVRGSAWFDHEFGSSVLDPGVAGWDWFGLQLDDGRELMAFVLRNEDGTLAPASAGTLVERDGRARPLQAADFTIEPLDTWRSPHTGAEYPSRWSLSIPAAELRLEIVPLLADAELVGEGSTDVVYWEGPVAVSGSVGGRGYGELTGYAGSMQGRF